MIMRFRTVLAIIAASMAVSACMDEARMMNIRATNPGPDEFGVVPTDPLTLPSNYAELPPPDPNVGNRADPNPEADAIAALGGNPNLLDRPGIPRSEASIVNAATRYGVSSDIRDVLAEEDAKFRSKHRGKLLERWFGTTVYFSAYSSQALDSYAELERLRRAGVNTPAAPPQN